MRRPLPAPPADSGWRTGPFQILDEFGNVIQPENACGTFEEQRTVECVLNDEVVGDYLCINSGPRPDETRTSTYDLGCTYSWRVDAWQDPGDSCTAAESQTRQVACQRDNDSVVVSDTRCTGAKPTTSRTVEDYSTCTYSWKVGEFEDPGSSCTAEETQTRDITCHRDLDDFQVSDAQCDSATRPAGSQQVEDYSSCSYEWQTDEFIDPGASCTDEETQLRTVWCARTLDGAVSADSECDAGSRPSANQKVEDYSGCSYEWDERAWGPWSSTCSSNANRSRTVNCLRSDGTVVNDEAERCLEDDGAMPPVNQTQAVYTDCSYSWKATAWQDPGASCSANESQSRTVYCLSSDGRTVADSYCTTAKWAETRTVADYSACGYEWIEGAWQDPGNSCTATETQTRSVTCRRSDGTTVETGCDPATKPATSQQVADYSGCGYEWDQTAWSAWSSTCSATANRTRNAFCVRSDGTTVSDSSCNASTKPTESQTQGVYTGCSFDWDTGAWQDPGASCTANESQTRTVECMRSDGTKATSETSCTKTKPSGSRSVADYSGCSYAWVEGAWNTGGASCTANESQSRSVTCRRSDGTTVDDSLCTSTKPNTTQSVPDYSGCSFSWDSSAWSAWSSTCSSNANRTRSVVCERSDGTVAASETSCTEPKPATSETKAVYSSCTYDWKATPWQDPGASCTANETQTRNVTCQSSDGRTVADSYCTTTKWAESRTVADYSACTFAWDTTNWSAWSNTCSSSATRTRSVTCERSDGTVAASESSCTEAKPAASQTQAVYSGCSYTWDSSAWSAWSSTCSSNATRSRTVRCERGDGTYVSDSSCTTAKPETDQTQAIYSGCAYTWDIGAWQDPGASCTTSETQTRTVRCERGDGTYVADSNCTTTKPSTTRTVSDDSGCTAGSSLTVDWGAWSWNSTCSSSATRSRTGTCEGDGQPVPNSWCTSQGIALTESYTGANYSGCTYDWDYTNWSSWSSSCSSSATRTRSVWCERSNGDNVGDSYCSGAGTKPASTNSGAVYSGCTYTATYGPWSTCSGGTQSRSITACTRSDGANVATSNCSPATQSQSCTMPAGTGPILYSDEFGGQTYTPCSSIRDETITKGQAGFPARCDNAGGTWFQRDVAFCEQSRDPYGDPYEAEFTETCRKY